MKNNLAWKCKKCGMITPGFPDDTTVAQMRDHDGCGGEYIPGKVVIVQGARWEFTPDN